MTQTERPHIAPSPVPVINIAPSAMPLPTSMSQVTLAEESPPMMRLLKEIRAKEVSHVLAVMSRPKVDTVPGRYLDVGVLCTATADNKHARLFLTGEFRGASVGGFKKKDNAANSYFVTAIRRLRDDDEGEKYLDIPVQQIRADLTKIKHLLQKIYQEAKTQQWDFNPHLMEYVLDKFDSIDFGDRDAVDKFVWFSLGSIPELLQEDKQPFLKSTGLLDRIILLISLSNSVLQMIERHKELDKSTSVDVVENSEEDATFEAKNLHPEIKKLWKKFKEVRDSMTEDAKVVAREDLERLVSYGSPEGNSHEWTKFRRRVKFLLELPWKRESESTPDIRNVAKVLDEDHAGLKHVKDRICEGIAPKILNPDGKGQIFSFIGPPGVGKTSLAKSIARALNRKLIRISLGGTRDEARIKGHDVTYIGSQSGEILREMHRCGDRNPVFVVDEVDKIQRSSSAGDPSAALLEVFDPEQNNSFRDHYADCGFDLSKVMFITTANVEEEIPLPLRDRMDIIRIPGYLEIEKVEIARKYLIPRWLKETGLVQNKVKVVMPDEMISKIVRDYTSEAGVRTLDKVIASISRKIATRYLESKIKGQPIQEFVVDEKLVVEFMGPAKVFKNSAVPTVVGEATGLAWTEVGGSILSVQSVLYPNPFGKKAFARTGMQGEVMKEADEVALTLVRNVLQKTDPERSKEWRRNGVHLHIPEGAIPKDGPSAGVTVYVSLYSASTRKVVKPYLAMTGEIDLLSRVLAVGGIREKVVAAANAGIKEVILPKANERNLHDVPQAIRDKLKFHFVSTVDEAIEIAFPKSP